MELQLYVDGSFTKVKPDITSGGMVLLMNDTILCAQRYKTKDRVFVDMNNIGGELLATINGITVAVEFSKQLSKEKEFIIHIFHDYNGIAKFIEGTPVWIPKKDGSKIYVHMINEFKQKYPDLKLKFTKIKAHTGNKWNDIADAIANGVTPIECKDKMLQEYIN